MTVHPPGNSAGPNGSVDPSAPIQPPGAGSEPGESVRLRLARADEPLNVIGRAALLWEPLLAIFASVAVPPDLVLPTFGFARALRARPVAVIGGFHTPLERCLLDVLARGDQPIVICPAQPLEYGRLSAASREGVARGRLAFVFPFTGAHRPTGDSGAKRNELVVRLASRVVVVGARAGSRTFRAAALALELGREVYAFDHPRNTDLFLIGAKPLRWRTKIPEGWVSRFPGPTLRASRSE